MNFRSSYSVIDRDCFLRHANCQHLWKNSAEIYDSIARQDSLCDEEELNSATLSVYKKYLSLLLETISQSEDQDSLASNPLMMYNAEVYA